jgi:hypothetical protein
MAVNMKILSWVVIYTLADLDLKGSNCSGRPGVSTKDIESTVFIEAFASKNSRKVWYFYL